MDVHLHFDGAHINLDIDGLALAQDLSHKLDLLLAHSNTLLRQGKVIMSDIQKFRDQLADIDAETTRVGAKIQELADKLANRTDMTDAEEAEVLAQLQAAGARLKTVAADPENPVPQPEPTPETPETPVTEPETPESPIE